MLGASIDIVAGAVLFFGSIFALAILRPGADGKVHRIASMRILETVIPMSIVGGLAIGVALLVAGLFPLILS